jgi:aminoglycoside phosphotransferase (APT) family kinase protein
MTQVIDTYNSVADANMIFLHEALEPEYMTSALQKSLQRSLKLNRIEVKRYKPERRCLIAYSFEDGVEDVTVFGKIRAKGLDKASYETQSYLCQTGLNVPQPLGVIPDLHMWLQEKVAGSSLTDVLQSSGSSSFMICVAQQLYQLHQLPPVISRQHTVKDELTILHDRLQRVATLKPAWSPRLVEVMKRCEQLAFGLPNVSAKGIHRDFYADQVLVADEKLYLLDFDLYALGDPALDVGNFLGHLTELALRLGDVHLFAELESVLESSYLNLNSEVSSQRVQTYKTLTLARHIFISTQFAERQAFTKGLLELCEERLG